MIDQERKNVLYCAAASLGPVPRNEEPILISSPSDLRTAILICLKYKDAIKRMVGHEPVGARLKIEEYSVKGNIYMDLICEYDAGIDAAANYAERCASLSPKTWAEAGIPNPALDIKQGNNR